MSEQSIQTSTMYECTVRFVIERVDGKISGVRVISSDIKPAEIVVSGKLPDPFVEQMKASMAEFNRSRSVVPPEPTTTGPIERPNRDA